MIPWGVGHNKKDSCPAISDAKFPDRRLADCIDTFRGDASQRGHCLRAGHQIAADQLEDFPFALGQAIKCAAGGLCWGHALALGLRRCGRNLG